MAGIYINKINLRDKEDNFYSFPNWVIGDYPTHITVDGQRNVPTRNITLVDANGNEVPLSGWTIGDILAMLAANSDDLIGNGGTLYIDTSVDPPELKIIKDGETYPISNNDIVTNGSVIYVDTSVTPPKVKIVLNEQNYPLPNNGGTLTAENGILKWISD